MTHKESVLAELDALVDPNFKIPAGLNIPVGNRVLVLECSQEEQKTQAGIILSATNNLQNAKLGIVYRIGEAVTIPVRISHKVAYSKFALSGVVHNGVQYTDLMEHEIYSVVPPENYFAPHVATTEEKRREGRQEFTKKSLQKSEDQMDQINNS